jgi:hypothetical protein
MLGVPHAECPPQANEQAWQLGKREFAEVDLQQILVEEHKRLTRVFQTAQRVLLGLGNVIKKAPNVG